MIRLVIFEIGQNVLLFSDLATVVICFFVSHLHLELEILQLLLLPLDLHTQLHIFPPQMLLIRCFLCLQRSPLLLLGHANSLSQLVEEIFALFGEHVDFDLFVQ